MTTALKYNYTRHFHIAYTGVHFSLSHSVCVCAFFVDHNRNGDCDYGMEIIINVHLVGIQFNYSIEPTHALAMPNDDDDDVCDCVCAHSNTRSCVRT